MRVPASARRNSRAEAEFRGSWRKYSTGRCNRSAMTWRIRVEGRDRPSSIWLRKARLKSLWATAARLSPSSIRALRIRMPSWSGVRGLQWFVRVCVAKAPLSTCLISRAVVEDSAVRPDDVIDDGGVGPDDVSHYLHSIRPDLTDLPGGEVGDSGWGRQRQRCRKRKQGHDQAPTDVRHALSFLCGAHDGYRIIQACRIQRNTRDLSSSVVEPLWVGRRRDDAGSATSPPSGLSADEGLGRHQ